MIALAEEWIKDDKKETRSEDTQKGGTMRLGSYPCTLTKGSLAEKIYKKTNITERHRHRYEMNATYEKDLKKVGMIISGINNGLPEIVERADHPFFIGVQFHPEFKSRPFAPHPLFVEFVKSSLTK